MKRLVILAFLALAACQSGGAPAASNAASEVLAAKASYAISLTGAVTYNELPRCAPTGPPLCSQQSIVETMRKANVAARTTLDAAERTVRDPGVSQSVAQAVVVGAGNAVQAFQAIVKLYSPVQGD